MRQFRRFSQLDKKGRAEFIALIVAMVVCLGVFVFALVQIIGIQSTYRRADAEYSSLQQNYAPNAQSVAAGQSLPANSQNAPDSTSEPPKPPEEINPDYTGWIEIPGTRVNYPVVRGADNEKYLNTTFEGASNAVGAIFMDCNNNADYSSLHTVIYGHNVKSGSMFGGLYKYLDASYLAKNPTINITTAAGTHTYQIFAARKTDMWDAAYRTGFADEADFANFAAQLGAPEGTRQILSLSTCTNGESHERILVHAALVA